MSLYQPFYPETFYSIWEFLSLKHIASESTNFLCVLREHHFGSVESLMLFNEKNHQMYQYNNYHVWTVGNEMFDNLNNYYNLLVPKINYLDQSYNIVFLTTTKNLLQYDFIMIDCIHKFKNINTWNTEELDLQSCLFYLLYTIKNLKKNGSILIKLMFNISSSWSIIFDMLYVHFKEYTFFRPKCINPLNPEIYLFLNKYDPKKFNPVLTNFLKKLYQQHTWQIFKINFKGHTENPIFKKFTEETNKWVEIASSVLDNYDNPKENTNKNLDDWHKSYDLMQIKHLTYDFDNSFKIENISTCANKYTLRPINPLGLYNMTFYKKLIQKRSELNYFKRVMDTKPSQIFLNNRRYIDSAELITWEELTSSVDMSKFLKNVLRTEYNAEMVTNAWIKMYEMLNMFPDIIKPSQNAITDSNSSFKSFHLCEAPGAFICSLNHYLSTIYPKINHDWYAQSLNPCLNYQALDDHYGLIKKYPNRWIFGDPKKDNSGDITHSQIIKFYANHASLTEIDFMTADAGIQCEPKKLNEQESCLGKINMGQIICILACLPVGKNAVFKTFLPMTEPLTISMIYLTTHLFEKVDIIKSPSSSCTNSEIYVMLRSYKGISKNILELLYILLDDPKITSKTLLFPEIDRGFFKSYMHSITSFVDRQIRALSKYYYSYYHCVGNDCSIDDFIKKWFEKNKITPLKTLLVTYN